MAAAGEGVRLIRALRLRNQGLVGGARTWSSTVDVARGMVAMQAQDPNGMVFGLSVRAASRPTEEAVLADFAAGAVVRNRPSRGTLQVTAPEDLHWLTELMAPRSNAAALKRRDQLGVTEEMVVAVGEVLRAELAGGTVRTRAELVEACAAGGVPLDGAQAGHVLRHHTEMMSIVFAGTQGRVDRFALADDWIGGRRRLERPAALAELATRFFAARGPATAQCLGWWANLAMGDVRAGIEGAGAVLENVEIGGSTFIVPAGSVGLSSAEIDRLLAEPLLLPPFDEYLLGYRSRDPVITAEHLDAVVPGRNGMFKPMVVVDGEIVGLWSKKATTKTVTVTVEPFDKLSAEAVDGLAQRAEEYGTFLGRSVTLAVAKN